MTLQKFDRRLFLLGSLVLVSQPVFAQSSARWGLILVGAGWCPFCRAAASILKTAEKNWGVNILVASQDNRAIEPFAEFVDARNHPIAREVRQIPTTLGVDLDHEGVTGTIIGYPGPAKYVRQLHLMAQNGLRGAS